MQTHIQMMFPDLQVLRAGYAVADHTRNALILSVFAFKV